MKIVRFKNGSYGIRKFSWSLMRYLFLTTENDWKDKERVGKGYVEMTIGQAEETFDRFLKRIEYLKDKGKAIRRK